MKQEMMEILKNIQNEISELKNEIKTLAIMNKDLLDIEDAALISGYTVKTLHKFSCEDVSFPVYSRSPKGKLFFRRQEFCDWLTQYKKYDFKKFHSDAEVYLCANN